MLCVCVGDVMDVVFYVCIVRRGAVGARVWGVLITMLIYIITLKTIAVSIYITIKIPLL